MNKEYNYGLVSIIMPSYNTAKYIKRSIQSVLAQTYENWELIIVDDCSTDDTVNKIKKFNDKRISLLINSKNYGAAVSRNRALKKAQGKYIAFLDSDDIWNKKKLEIQLRFMKKNGYSFTYTDYRIQENGNWMPYICTGPKRVDLRKLYNYCYFSTITVMYDRDTVGLIQIADIKKNNDYAMWYQALEKTDAHRLPKCLSYYIKHTDSVSGGSKWKLIRWHYLLYKEGLSKGRILSICLTINNIFFGVIKKTIYKRRC